MKCNFPELRDQFPSEFDGLALENLILGNADPLYVAVSITLISAPPPYTFSLVTPPVVESP